MTVALWAAMALGGLGVIAALVAVAAEHALRPGCSSRSRSSPWCPHRGACRRGSTDSISYAASGRTAVIGHSPYVMTPLALARSGYRVGRQIPFGEIPSSWTTTVSVYGPVATGAEWVAAELGGTSLAQITFWLKLLEALSFCAVIWILDRLLRPIQDEAMRLRAHLLWSVNPLLLWEIVAGGHIDGLAVVFGLLGIVALRARPQHDAAGPAAAGPAAAPAAGPPQRHRWTCRRPRCRVSAARRRRRGRPVRPADRSRGRHQGGIRLVRPGRRRGVPPVAAGAGRRGGGFRGGGIPASLAAGTARPVLLTRTPGSPGTPCTSCSGARPRRHAVQRVEPPAAPGTGCVPAVRGRCV